MATLLSVCVLINGVSNSLTHFIMTLFLDREKVKNINSPSQGIGFVALSLLWGFGGKLVFNDQNIN